MILAGNSENIFEINYEVLNEDLNIWNITFTTNKDLRNIISSAEIVKKWWLFISPPAVITDTSITFSNVRLPIANNTLSLKITTNSKTHNAYCR